MANKQTTNLTTNSLSNYVFGSLSRNLAFCGLALGSFVSSANALPTSPSDGNSSSSSVVSGNTGGIENDLKLKSDTNPEIITPSVKSVVIPIKVNFPHEILVNNGDTVEPNTRLIKYSERVVAEHDLKLERAILLENENLKTLNRMNSLYEKSAVSKEEVDKALLSYQLSSIDRKLSQLARLDLDVFAGVHGSVRANTDALNPAIIIQTSESTSTSIE
jgi:hypothetical protein